MNNVRFKVALQANLAVLLLLIGAGFFLPLSMLEKIILMPFMALLVGLNWALLDYVKRK